MGVRVGLVGLAAGLLVAGCTEEVDQPSTRPAVPAADLTGKKVLIVIASQDFRDEEFQEPFSRLTGKHVSVTVASSRKELAVGALQQVRVKPDRLLTEVTAADFDAVVFVGGPGAREYFDNPTALALAREAASGGKIVAAICIAPTILANAGVLQGKAATVFNDEELRQNLTVKGARLGTSDVVVDGRVITADGPKAAPAFAEAILKALAEP